MDEATFATAPGPPGITAIVGQSLFAIYNWLMIIILINMLIAMMSRSYDIISVSSMVGVHFGVVPCVKFQRFRNDVNHSGYMNIRNTTRN